MKPITLIRAMLGWTIGILIGMYGALIVIFFMPMNIYLKIFTLIGLFSASLGTLYSLFEIYQRYKMISAGEILFNDLKGGEDATIQEK